MTEDDDEALPAVPGEWYVLFTSGGKYHWWEWFDRPGFGHVLAFAYSAHGQVWLIYDVTRHRTFVHVLKPDNFVCWLDAVSTWGDMTVLKLATRPLEPVRLARLGFWCTIAVKHLLGVRSRALRPKALCRDLLTMGATYAFGTGPAHEDHRPTGEGNGRGEAAAGG